MRRFAAVLLLATSCITDPNVKGIGDDVSPTITAPVTAEDSPDSILVGPPAPTTADGDPVVQQPITKGDGNTTVNVTIPEMPALLTLALAVVVAGVLAARYKSSDSIKTAAVRRLARAIESAGEPGIKSLIRDWGTTDRGPDVVESVIHREVKSLGNPD